MLTDRALGAEACVNTRVKNFFAIPRFFRRKHGRHVMT